MTRIIITILLIYSSCNTRANKEFGSIDYTKHVYSFQGEDYRITDTCSSMIVISKGGKMGFVNEKGELLQLPEFDLVFSFKTSATVVVLNNKYGIISNTGKVILECKYEKIEPFNCSVTAYQKDNRWGLVSDKGKFVLAPHFYHIFNVSDDMAVCRTMNNKYILVNANGKTIDTLTNETFALGNNFDEDISPTRRGNSLISYAQNSLYTFHDGIAIGKEKDRNSYYYINKNNQPLFGKNFLKLRPFFNGLACVKTEKGWNIMDLTGEYLLTNWYSFISLTFEHIIVGNGEKFGVLDLKGNEIIPLKHQRIAPLGDDLFAFCDTNKSATNELGASKWGVINAKNEIILKPIYEGLDWDSHTKTGRAGLYGGLFALPTGLVRYNYWGHFMEFNEKGKISEEKHDYGMTVDEVFNRYSGPNYPGGNHLAFAPEINMHKYGYSSATASITTNGLLEKGTQTSYSLIDEGTGNKVIKEDISSVEFYPNCLIVRDRKQNTFILDLLGKELFRANNTYITGTESGLFRIYNEGRHYVINACGEEIKFN